MNIKLEKIKTEYNRQGSVVVKNLLKKKDFKDIFDLINNKIKKYKDFKSLFDKNFVNFAIDNPDIISSIYDSMISNKLFLILANKVSFKKIVFKLISEKSKIYKKIILRIDLPEITKELAVWHQDDFYVNGRPNELVAWIPLQDVPMQMGALSVIKKTHKFGKIPHNIKWGKKHMPTEDIYKYPINIVELKFGDVLFFNSFLVHSGNINFSNKIRYSLQMRFTSEILGGKPSRLMGGTYEI